MIFEAKIHFFKNFLFKWLDMDWHGHDCGYTSGGHIFQNRVMHALYHDYVYVGVVDISAVDAYSGVEVCKPIFLGEASK
jgi:hypothetical protein